MKTNFKLSQKIIALVLTIIIAFAAYLPAKPAYAIDPITELFTGLTSVYTLISKTYDQITSYSQDSLWIKAYILDPLAWAAAKALLQNITDETVNWINSGFNGSPAYITNPTHFLENIGDQATGALIGESGLLTSLCSPISLNVRLAIALGQAGPSATGNPYTCTLSTIVDNVQGATINGFTAGDFSQGGWPAFASLAEPQNSFYGAYLEAESSLSTSIANRTQQKNNELLQGGGFLTFQTCTDDLSLTDEDAFYDPTVQLDQAAFDKAGYNIYETCQNSTPGSTIKSSLDKALGTSQDSLVQASMIDEVIGALAGQLVNKVLGSGGLAGVSQPMNGQPSYLSQIEGEVASSSVASSLNSSIPAQISQHITSAQNIQSYASSSITTAGKALASLLSASSTCQSDGDTAVVSQIGTAIASTTAWVTQLQDNYANITEVLNNLISFNAQMQAATSTAEVNSLTQQYGNMLASVNPQSPPYIQTLPSIGDEYNAKDDNTSATNIYNSINQQASQYTQQCNTYAHPANNGGF